MCVFVKQGVRNPEERQAGIKVGRGVCCQRVPTPWVGKHSFTDGTQSDPGLCASDKNR